MEMTVTGLGWNSSVVSAIDPYTLVFKHAVDSPATPLTWDATRNATIAWALTGDSQKTSVVAPLVEPAELKVYARFSLPRNDYPALIKRHETSIVDGLLLFPRDKSQRKKLDDFEGGAYIVTPVQVTVISECQMVDRHTLVEWRTRRSLGGLLGSGHIPSGASR